MRELLFLVFTFRLIPIRVVCVNVPIVRYIQRTVASLLCDIRWASFFRARDSGLHETSTWSRRSGFLLWHW